MIAKFDDFNRLEQPSLVLTNPEEIPISFIDEHYIKNFIFKPKFNDISEITFDIYEHFENGQIFKGYKNLIQRMRITVEGYGSWIISNVTEAKSNVDDVNHKSITLKSTEYEIQDIQIPYIDGTYKLYDVAQYEKSLLGTVLSKIPRWRIEHVDSTIASLYRTFEVPDSNVLSFLLNDVQEAYGCLFIFDCLNRTISVYDKDTYVKYTGILLTNDELIDSMEITRSDENLITALSVFGDDDLGINAVNPLGTSSIYNFSQVKQWMSPELLSKLNSWEKEITNAETTVKNKNIEIAKLNAELTSIDTQVASQEQTLKGLKSERDVIISKNNQSELDSINSQISTAESQLSTFKLNQTNKKDQLAQKQNELSTIQGKLSPSVYFGNLYNNFLSYVYENEYTNDNIAVTDSMTYEERIAEIQTLYDTAKDVLLQKVNIPNEYSVDTKAFVFNKKFINHIRTLEVGSLIGVETENSNDGNIEYFPIIEFEINYEDKSVTITFGNKFNPARAKDLFADLMHDVSSTGKILDYITAKKVDTSEISDMQKFINSTLDLSKNAILSANGQTVEINDSGYHGRRLNSDGSLDKEEVAIINNTIAFTKDNWNTCSLALGKLTLDNGVTVYGIIAEALIGKLIMGESLYISNTKNTFIVDENGLNINNTINSFIVNPNDDKLLKLSNSNGDIFYVDKNGMLHIKGDGAGLDISNNESVNAIHLTIKATNDAIVAEVKRASDTEGILSASISMNESCITSEITRATEAEGNLSSKITQTAESITAEVTRATEAEENLSASIKVNAESITSEVTRAQKSENNLSSRISQTADSITSIVSSNPQDLNNIPIEDLLYGYGAPSTTNVEQKNYYDMQNGLLYSRSSKDEQWSATPKQCNSIFQQTNEQISARVTKTGGDITSFGWYLDSDAFVLASSSKEVFRCDNSGIVINGTINAYSGSISGLNIFNTHLVFNGENQDTGSGIVGTCTFDNIAFWAGSHDSTNGYTWKGVRCPFYVTHDGKLHAENAEISGYTTTQEFQAVSAEIGSIKANYVTTEILKANYITTSELEVKYATIDDLEVTNIAVSGKLDAKEFTASKISALGITVDSARINGILSASQLATGAGANYSPAWSTCWVFKGKIPGVTLDRDDDGNITGAHLTYSSLTEIPVLLGVAN